MLMDNEQTAAAAAVIVMLCQSQQLPARKKKRFWSKRWQLQRKQFSHMALINELREKNTDDFKNYLRMSDENFWYLLNLVRPEIKKQDTKMRKAISAEERLIAILRFLATGRSLEDLKFSTGISLQRLGVIPETCKAIVKVLRKDFMKVSK
ncbi:unnamed protein product [Lasius platythorax]|uniref:Uncharacterized protein n=1 Tax=Lasius platythorax TaxID=488582 RepID=A0AAV2MYH9_9HYME